jgi:polyhydroxyalkanoate synthesis regulator phasin
MRPKGNPSYLNRLIGALIFASILGVTGCEEFRHLSPTAEFTNTPEGISPSTILVPNPQDAQFLEILGIRADTQLSQCRNMEGCNQAHFLKALTALHANTDVAGYHFQKVIESSPSTRLSHASRVWLWLLEEIRPSNSQHTSSQNITRELIQALLQRDLDLVEKLPVPSTVSPDLKPHLVAQEAKVNALSEKIHELSQEVATLKTKSASMHSLQQDLQARDKKVAELTNQLDALRRIDQEIKKKAPPTTPSENILTPKEETRDKP